MKKGMMIALLAGVMMIAGHLEARKAQPKDESEYTRIASDKALCAEGSCLNSKKSRKACSCWCSEICGNREIIKNQDQVTFTSKDSQGQEIPARCYCNPWDVEHYLTNCAAKEQEAEPSDAEDQSRE